MTVKELIVELQKLPGDLTAEYWNEYQFSEASEVSVIQTCVALRYCSGCAQDKTCSGHRCTRSIEVDGSCFEHKSLAIIGQDPEDTFVGIQ